MRSLAVVALASLLACSQAVAPSVDAPDTTPGSAPNVPPSARGDRVDLGEQPVGTPIAFDVPEGTVGFTVVVDRAVTADDFLGVQELVDPSGKTVVRDYRDASNEGGRALDGQSGTGVGVLRLPFANDHATDAVPAGRWTVKLGGSRMSSSGKNSKGTLTPLDGSIHGRVFIRTSTGGVVDLDVYVPEGLLVDGTPVNAASAETALETRIDLAYGLFQRLYGLDRGAVRFHAIDGSVKAIVGLDGLDAANVLADAPQTDHPAAQVVLTNRLSPDGVDQGEISGISCLPGAVGVPATKCSAVLVSLRASSPDWMDASTIAHELGHFAGLEHTTELDGSSDALADTPVCSNLSKTALPSCEDHDNLMFPSVSSADGEPSIAVSAKQRALFLSSSLAH